MGRRETVRRKEGASLSRTGLRDQFNAWLQHHRLSAADSLLRVLDNPGSSLLTWLVIGIALALPVGLNVALDNVSQVSAGWDSPAQISLFLQDGVAVDRAKQLEVELDARKDIGETRFLGLIDQYLGLDVQLAFTRQSSLWTWCIIHKLPNGNCHTMVERRNQ